MNRRLHRLIVESVHLKGAAYQVMLAIAWKATSTCTCAISLSDLAMDAHLTKKSVISALHLLAAPQNGEDSRSILVKTSQGCGTSNPNTYLVSIELLRDLKRERRHLAKMASRASATRDVPTLDTDTLANGETGFLGTPAIMEELLTLRGHIDNSRSESSTSTGSGVLTKSEVNQLTRIYAKQAALDIIAMANGTKAIPWMTKPLGAESRPDETTPSISDKSRPAMVNEVVQPEAHEGSAVSPGDSGGQLTHPRSEIFRPRVGAQIPRVAGNSTGILWWRR